jgi:hypothetical protein
MEMPKGCYDCEIRDGKAYCPICGATLVGYKRSRHENCPILCSLPEGHGRLGDLDALTRLMLERKQPLVGADNSKDRYRYIQWLADFNAIKDAKTIVPAERSKTCLD